MKDRLMEILKRLRKIWELDSIKIAIDFWEYNPDETIKLSYTIWIETISQHFFFKSIEEIEEWLYKKELLFKKF